jgi:Sugar-transfer associated ATP-grasp
MDCMRVEAVENADTLAGAVLPPAGDPDGGREVGAALRGRSEAGPSRAVSVASGEDEAAGRANDGHAVTRDRADRDRVKPAIIDYLHHAQKMSGRGALDLTREFIRLNRGPGRLTWPEYVQYRVYDRTRYGPADQARFLTNTLHWPITHACCDMTWQATTEDKWLCSHILARSPIRVPETLAVVDRSGRAYLDTTRISTARQLRDFMMSRDVLPLFGKENRGICSFGAFLAVDADEKAMLLKGQGWLGYDECMERFIGTTPYLLQRLERNHGFFDRYTDNLATVRVCLLVGEDDIKIPFAVLKLPSRTNVADSFWRPGNLACNLDVQSGRILTARSKDGFGTTDHTVHPGSGVPPLGETVPMWERVLDLARPARRSSDRCASSRWTSPSRRTLPS